MQKYFLSSITVRFPSDFFAVSIKSQIVFPLNKTSKQSWPFLLYSIDSTTILNDDFKKEVVKN